MNERETRDLIAALAIVACTLIVSIAAWALYTVGKDVNFSSAIAQKTGEMKICIDGGGSYINGECVRIQCSDR